MTETFAIGELARLKSGGPSLVITGVEGGFVRAVGFDQAGTRLQMEEPAACFVKVEELKAPDAVPMPDARPTSAPSGPPQLTPAGAIPPNVQQAAFELLAHMLNQQSVVFNITLQNITVEGRPAGDFEISIRKID